MHALRWLALPLMLSLCACSRACMRSTPLPQASSVDDDPDEPLGTGSAPEPRAPAVDAGAPLCVAIGKPHALPAAAALGNAVLTSKGWVAAASRSEQGARLSELHWNEGEPTVLGRTQATAPPAAIAAHGGRVIAAFVDVADATSRPSDAGAPDASSTKLALKTKTDATTLSVLGVSLEGLAVTPLGTVSVPKEISTFAVAPLADAPDAPIVVAWDERSAGGGSSSSHRAGQPSVALMDLRTGKRLSVPAGGRFVDDLRLTRSASGSLLLSWMTGDVAALDAGTDPDEGAGLGAEYRYAMLVELRPSTFPSDVGLLQASVVGDKQQHATDYEVVSDSNGTCVLLHEPVPPSDEIERVRVFCREPSKDASDAGAKIGDKWRNPWSLRKTLGPHSYLAALSSRHLWRVRENGESDIVQWASTERNAGSPGLAGRLLLAGASGDVLIIKGGVSHSVRIPESSASESSAEPADAKGRLLLARFHCILPD
jgi:hypothetical protein